MVALSHLGGHGVSQSPRFLIGEISIEKTIPTLQNSVRTSEMLWSDPEILSGTQDT